MGFEGIQISDRLDLKRCGPLENGIVHNYSTVFECCDKLTFR